MSGKTIEATTAESEHFELQRQRVAHLYLKADHYGLTALLDGKWVVFACYNGDNEVIWAHSVKRGIRKGAKRVRQMHERRTNPETAPRVVLVDPTGDVR